MTTYTDLKTQLAAYAKGAEKILDTRGTVMAEAIAAIEELEARNQWQPIETAPKDGTEVDLWGVNHLHYNKIGVRLNNIAWGRVTDWIGREYEDWQTGRGEDFEPTHWMPLPQPPEQDQ